MSGHDGEADSPLVDTVERGESIRRRRMALGIRSVREMAIRSGVSRGAATAAEHGEGSSGTYDRLEAWLASQEQPASQPVSLEQIEFTVSGDFGVTVTVKGPISDRSALEESVAKIIRSIRAETGDSSD